MSRVVAAVKRAFQRQKEINGIYVVYTRSADAAAEISVTLTAVPTDESTETTTPGATIARHETNERSYLIAVDDLVLGGCLTLPMRGDRIQENAACWELLSRASEPAWKFLDQTRTVYLVHTKRVS